MNRQEQYRQYCAELDDVEIFSEPWWLDATAGSDNWSAAFAKQEDEKILGALPFMLSKKWGMITLQKPQLTPYFNLLIPFPSDMKSANKTSLYLEVVKSIIEDLPKYNHFKLQLSPEIKNWLPFFWDGFNQTTRYTYRISREESFDQVKSKFRTRIKRNIKKAQKLVSVVESDDPSQLYRISQLTFERQGKKMGLPESKFIKLDNACKARKQRKILLAQDGEGQIHAGIYLVWDKNTVYYLKGGGDPNLRNSGANALLFSYAINEALQSGKSFDFEGSMIPSIEHYFRAFGGEQLPYFKITKFRPKWLKALYTLVE